MQEIKIRVWDRKRQEMLYSEVRDNPNEMLLRWDFRGSWSVTRAADGFVLNPNCADLMLSPGLQDIMGETLYAGDITNNGIIRFGRYNDSYIGFYLEDTEWCNRGGKLHHDVHDLFAFTTPFRLLGNIYQNPELLEAK